MANPVNEDCSPTMRSSKVSLPVLDSSGETHRTCSVFVTKPCASSPPNIQVTLSPSLAVNFKPDTMIGVPPSSLPYRGESLILPEIEKLL